MSSTTGRMSSSATRAAAPLRPGSRADLLRASRRQGPLPDVSISNAQVGVPRVLGWLLAQDQRARRIDERDAECIAVGHSEPAGRHDPHLVADRELLPLEADLLGIVDIQTEKVLQPRVAVHAAAALPDLHEPAPHLRGRGVHGDTVGGRGHRSFEELIARVAHDEFLVRGAPVAQPRPADRSRGDSRRRARPTCVHRTGLREHRHGGMSSCGDEGIDAQT